MATARIDAAVMQLTSVVNRSDYIMDCCRPLWTSGQVGRAWRLLPCSVAKRCRDIDHQRDLSLLRQVREAGSIQPDARRHPQELQHAGDKSVNVNECPLWTREGKELPVYLKIGPLPLLAKLQRWLSQFCRPEAVA
jgi:hypothetical protein